MGKNRILKYAEAIREAHIQSLDKFPEAFIMGVGVADETGIFGTTKGLAQRFSNKRVFDTPMSENTLSGLAAGSAATGMRPVLVHARNDFLLLTLDQVANQAAKWSYMSGGAYKMPFLIRAIIGRGWGQGAQHSQSLQSVFMYFPGLQVIMPTTPYDAKGMILSAMESDKPTICLEHRWLYEKAGPVPEEYYTVPIGKGRIARKGTDITIVGVSHAVIDAERASVELEREGISVEIIDLRSLRPLDVDIIVNSVKKTKRLVICDTGWKSAGASAEILATVAELAHGVLIAPPVRIANADTPTPFAPNLESIFYPSIEDITNTVRNLVRGTVKVVKSNTRLKPTGKPFSGPF